MKYRVNKTLNKANCILLSTETLITLDSLKDAEKFVWDYLSHPIKSDDEAIICELEIEQINNLGEGSVIKSVRIPTKYITITNVKNDWESKAMCVEFTDGSDAMLQDNGYTIEDAEKFAAEGCRFFYD